MKATPRSRATTSHGLLNALIRAVRTEPQRLLMDDWVVTFGQHFERAIHGLKPECGTIACAAGWIKILRRPRDADATTMIHGYTESFALSQFPVVARDAMSSLFYTFPPFKPGTREYVDYVVAKIRAIQKEHGTDLKAFKLEPLR